MYSCSTLENASEARHIQGHYRCTRPSIPASRRMSSFRWNMPRPQSHDARCAGAAPAHLRVLSPPLWSTCKLTVGPFTLVHTPRERRRRGRCAAEPRCTRPGRPPGRTPPRTRGPSSVWVRAHDEQHPDATQRRTRDVHVQEHACTAVIEIRDHVPGST